MNDMRFPFKIQLQDSPTARWWEGFFRAVGTLFYSMTIFMLGIIFGAVIIVGYGGCP